MIPGDELLPLLAAWGRATWVRAALAVARAHEASWRERFARPEAAQASLAAAGAWLDEPSPARAAACLEAAEALRDAREVARGALRFVPFEETSDQHAAIETSGLAEIAARCAFQEEGQARAMLGEVWRVHSEDQAALIRAALAPWALTAPADVPLPDWPGADPDPRQLEAERASLAAFSAALSAPATRRAATALRKRLRAKELARERVELAADLGQPAAWLVCKREGAPDLGSPGGAAELVARVEHAIEAYAAPVQLKVPTRRFWTDEAGEAQRATAWRARQGPLRWPVWGRTAVLRVALELAQRAAARAGDALAPPLAEALAAARTCYACPCAPHAEEASQHAERAAAQEGSAARVIAAAAALAGRAPGRWNPDLAGGRWNVVAEALAAGEAPAALWAHLRALLAAWALDQDDLGAGARPYSARERFAPGERIRHPKFGEGRVTRAEGDKIEVAFPGQARTLVQGRP